LTNWTIIILIAFIFLGAYLIGCAFIFSEWYNFLNTATIFII
jgi:hypothetical protein